MKFKIQVLCDAKLYDWSKSSRCFEEWQYLHIEVQVLQYNFTELLDPEVEGNTMLRNVEDYTPNEPVSTTQSRIFNNTVMRISDFALTIPSYENVPNVPDTATPGRKVSIWCSVTFFKVLLCEVQLHLGLSIFVATHAFRRLSRHHAWPEYIGAVQCHDIVCLLQPLPYCFITWACCTNVHIFALH
jgi:hypothetical protein